MLSKRRPQASLLVLAFAACATLIVTGSTRGGIINVPGDCPTIQAAIDAAQAGDEVVVAEGVYHESINFLGKGITVRSTDPSDPAVVVNTIIDGEGAYHVVQCVSEEGPFTVLSGFVITGGNACGDSFPDDVGGGMLNYESSPTVTNCTFAGNSAGGGVGGGMANVHYSSPKVTNCTFINNSATAGGGGMYNEEPSPPAANGRLAAEPGADRDGTRRGAASGPTVISCAFIANSAGDSGGAMCNMWAVPSVTGCVFDENTAESNGGAMFNYAGQSDIAVTHCTFTGNRTNGRGGAMANSAHCPTVMHCTFINNRADECGGGIDNWPGLTMLVHTVVCGNSPDQVWGDWTDGGGNVISLYPPPPGPPCPADVDGDGDVDTSDLLALLAAWGMCP